MNYRMVGIARSGAYPKYQKKQLNWTPVLILLLLAASGFTLATHLSTSSSAAFQTGQYSSAQSLNLTQSSAAPTTTSEASTTTATPGVTVTPQATQVPTAFNASVQLKRISQLNPSEYDSPQQEATWGMSACSTAALTEVMDSYGFSFAIADVLHVEAQIGAITVQDGLTTESGIANTAKLFGFSTQWGHNLSLSQIISKANAGQPVIVSWPPLKYTDGHIVVVVGGNSTTVRIADSSLYNRTSVSLSQFNSWWGGFSAILSLPTGNIIAGKPTVTAAFINQVLAKYHSPAAGLGQSLYNWGLKYDIDPVYALAFFQHESTFGTRGMATITDSLGNSRCVPNYACVRTDGSNCPDPEQESCYAKYPGWGDTSFQPWYQQMLYYENGSLEYYLNKQWKPLLTLQEIIPVYAPSADNNNPAQYISSLQNAVATWRAGNL